MGKENVLAQKMCEANLRATSRLAKEIARNIFIHNLINKGIFNTYELRNVQEVNKKYL